MPAAKQKPETLQARTGLVYPHRDPRLVDALQVLAEKRAFGTDEELLWVLCALVWHLTRTEAERLGAEIERILRPRAGYSTGR